MNSTSPSSFGWRAGIAWFLAGAGAVFVLVEHTRIASELAVLRAERERLAADHIRTQSRLDRVEGTIGEWEQRRQRGETTFSPDRRPPESGPIVRAPGFRNRTTDFFTRPSSPGGIEAPAPALPPEVSGRVSDNPGRRGWGHEQAVGPPDTPTPGDHITAWASRDPDAGPEWLRLQFEKSVEIAEVRVRETYNPGAVSRVVAIRGDGGEQVVWEGTADTAPAPRDFVVPAAGGIVAKTIVVHLDTVRVPGWNEIDAVQLVGKDGSRQWAVSSSASSTYADLAQPSPTESFDNVQPIPSPTRP